MADKGGKIVVNKILLLTHFGWGEQLVKSVEMIIGKIDFVYEIPLTAEQTLEDYQNAVNEFLGDSEEYVIFTDLFGGTTTNVAALVTRDRNIDVITGLNSPLLIEACSQIMFENTFNIERLLGNSENSIFDVKKKIGTKGGE